MDKVVYIIIILLYIDDEMIKYKKKLEEQLDTFETPYNLMENAVKRLDYTRREDFGILLLLFIFIQQKDKLKNQMNMQLKLI